MKDVMKDILFLYKKTNFGFVEYYTLTVWLLKRNVYFQIDPVICPWSLIIASEAVMSLGVASCHYRCPHPL